MRENAGYFATRIRERSAGSDVREREVDFFVVVVELRAGGVGYAVEVVEEECYGPCGWDRGGEGWVCRSRSVSRVWVVVVV